MLFVILLWGRAVPFPLSPLLANGVTVLAGNTFHQGQTLVIFHNIAPCAWPTFGAPKWTFSDMELLNVVPPQLGTLCGGTACTALNPGLPCTHWTMNCFKEKTLFSYYVFRTEG